MTPFPARAVLWAQPPLRLSPCLCSKDPSTWPAFQYTQPVPELGYILETCSRRAVAHSLSFQKLLLPHHQKRWFIPVFHSIHIYCILHYLQSPVVDLVAIVSIVWPASEFPVLLGLLERKLKCLAKNRVAAAAAAKSLQSCTTLGDPIDSSPPGSPVPGILQARTLEWVAISFSNAWKWKVKVKLLSCAWL